MNICYDGIGYLAVTIPAGTCQAGQVCKLSADGQADSCTAGEQIAGICDEVKKGLAAVQVGGFAKVTYSGSTPGLGFAKLAADGNGGVCVTDGAVQYLVIGLDESSNTITIKL